jgi:hypothetical protein
MAEDGKLMPTVSASEPKASLMPSYRTELGPLYNEFELRAVTGRLLDAYIMDRGVLGVFGRATLLSFMMPDLVEPHFELRGR